MLAENTQINPDSVCYIYNKVIEVNLIQLALKSKANFTYIDGNAIQGTYHDILGEDEPHHVCQLIASDVFFRIILIGLHQSFINIFDTNDILGFSILLHCFRHPSHNGILIELSCQPVELLSG